jgi:AAA+ ATPase superfamily predicted ATPase
MTVITGRRRIGKTRLIMESLQDQPYLYFFIARKEERLLCEEFIKQIQDTLSIPIYGTITRFKDIFTLLTEYSKNNRLNLVIDEFQEFNRINPSVYSDMQQVWDRYKDQSSMNLILSGSVHSLMKKIFENSKEPLFGRANEKLFIKPFSVSTLKEIYESFNSVYEQMDLLAFYIFTGGVPKYVEQFVDKNCFVYRDLLDEILRENSIFLEEGKNVLIEEFGKEYGTYFSVLSLIASGKTSRSAIESVLQKDVGGFLNRLENEYQIINKVRPIFAKPQSRNVKYFIDDNFLSFWFRFLYSNRGAIEISNFSYLKKLIDRDFSTFSGRFLEKYFRRQLAATKAFSQIGNYWEKGNKNEIDIVAINELERKALIAEVKLNEKQISVPKLEAKAYSLARTLGGYEIEYRGFSLKDM